MESVYTYIEGPADPLDLDAWKQHLARLVRLVEEHPHDEGFRDSLRAAEFTVADIERVEKLIP